MACTLTSGRYEPCKDSISGIKAIYVAPYNYLYPYEYTTFQNELLTFPSTDIYRFPLRNDGNTFTEDNDGEKWSQNLTLVFPKLGKRSSLIVDKLSRKDYRVIVEFRNGLIKILGMENGLSLTAHSLTSGGGKADFNGYNLTFQGQELEESYYMDGIESVGFNIADNTEDYLFQDIQEYDFQDDIDYEF